MKDRWKLAAVFLASFLISTGFFLPLVEEEQAGNVTVTGEVKKVSLGSTVLWMVDGEKRSYFLSGLNLSTIEALEGRNVTL